MAHLANDFHCAPTTPTFVKFFETVNAVSKAEIGLPIFIWPDNLRSKPSGMTLSSLIRDR